MSTKNYFLKHRQYPEATKIRVVKECLLTNRLRKDIQAEFNIPHDTYLYRWIEIYGDRILAEAQNVPLVPKKPSKPKSNKELSEKQQMEQRIKKLERELEDAQLKALLYENMIEIAEKQFNIPIGKKLGPQQSSKPKGDNK
jgi:transposase-like protein